MIVAATVVGNYLLRCAATTEYLPGGGSLLEGVCYLHWTESLSLPVTAGGQDVGGCLAACFTAGDEPEYLAI